MMQLLNLIQTLNYIVIIISDVLENLKEAIIGETTAKIKYNLFSKKATDEGYSEVAHLFKAISRAEEIHIKNHIKAYEKINNQKFDKEILNRLSEKEIQQKVKDTRNNLIQAIAGEKYEFQKMYKSFIKTAKKQDQFLAEFSFNLARNAENIHRKLFIKFLKAFQNNSLYNYKKIYICKICGNVVLDDLPSICQICEHNQVFFEEI